jgi:hypothetical protein
MSQNPRVLYCFTAEEIREHDLDVAMEAQQIVTDHLVKDLNDKTPGQIVRAARGNGEDALPLNREEMRAAQDAVRAVREATLRKNDDNK